MMQVRIDINNMKKIGMIKKPKELWQVDIDQKFVIVSAVTHGSEYFYPKSFGHIQGMP